MAYTTGEKQSRGLDGGQRDHATPAVHELFRVRDAGVLRPRTGFGMVEHALRASDAVALRTTAPRFIKRLTDRT